MRGKFASLSLNAMSFAKPHDLYVSMAEFLENETLTPRDSLQYLQKKFCGDTCDSVKKSFILIVDEIDYLCTKKQDVFYNLFDWAHRASSKLILVSIANTFDLPERMMSNKVSSRFVICF